MANLNIACGSANVTVRFAADELIRYLKRMGGDVAGEPGTSYAFVLGTFEELESVVSTGERHSHWDDAIFMKSVGGKLVLSGPNPRSVLFSVYAYLERLGCCWLYPGPAGEEIPCAEIQVEGLDIFQRASARFRGAAPFPDEDGGEQYIDWMAKRRLNYYFSEYFMEARPGGRYGNLPLDEKDLRVIAWKRKMLEAARLRGMLIESYGHGWARGLVARFADEKGLSQDEAYQAIRAHRPGRDDDLKAANIQHQEFCLSHPDVQRILIEHIGDFLEAHQDEQDVAGVWMGDGWDLACQCERCKTRPFSNWYLDIIRPVAARLKGTAPRLKIECLVYMTTLPAPDGRPLEGLDNIIMMLAPMGRCYRHTLFDETCRNAGWAPDFRNNRSLDLEHFHHPLNGDYMDALRAWRSCVDAPWYLFDYFNWFQTAWNKSFLGYLPESLAREAATLSEQGFAGMVPCHYTQSAFPTNLTMWTLAGLLWDRTADVRTLRRTYLEGQFGGLALVAEQHLEAMWQVLMRLTPHQTPLWQEPEALLAEVAAELTVLRDSFTVRFAGSPDAGVERRLFWLKADVVLQAGVYQALAWHAAGQDERAGEVVNELLAFLEAHKAELNEVLHVKFARWLVQWMPGKFKKKTDWVV